MTSSEWATANLPNYALYLAQVRGRVRVIRHHSGGRIYAIPGVIVGWNEKYDNRRDGRRYRVMCAKCGAPHTYQSIAPSAVITIQEWMNSRKVNDHV